MKKNRSQLAYVGRFGTEGDLEPLVSISLFCKRILPFCKGAGFREEIALSPKPEGWA